MSTDEAHGPNGHTPAFFAASGVIPELGLESLAGLSSAWISDISTAMPACSLPPTKILVVEDEATLAAMLAMILEDEGFSVRVARDGMEGLELFDDDRPDLVVTDYMMPRMDGTTFIARLRASGETLPIIMASAIASRQMVDAQNLAVDAFLMKPYRDSQLLGLIRDLLASSGRTSDLDAPEPIEDD